MTEVRSSYVLVVQRDKEGERERDKRAGDAGSISDEGSGHYSGGTLNTTV